MTGKDEATLEKRKAVIKTSMELRRALRATERAIKAAKRFRMTSLSLEDLRK
jgi:hypothetical protein